ncbi:MAG: MraY family glycosyltransferase [Bryobacteraceae bacterium]
MYSIIFLTIAAFICCLILTPLVRRLSQRIGALDLPNATRKLHASPIPRTGGVAIAGAYLFALALLAVAPLKGATKIDVPLIVSLLPAAGVVFATGLMDDFMGLNAWEKLFGQIGAACLAYWGGVHVAGFAGFMATGWWSFPATVFWLVGCANAFNLIDGVDGLATGIGLFATFTTLAAALLQNNVALAMAMAPLLGALLAFLRYNFNPASIFLGDCGSLTIGFLLGCAGAVWSQKSATMLGMTAPLLALAVPLLDTTIAIVRRFLRHQPIFGADRGHVHHKLLDRGFSPRVVVLVLYGFCGLAAAFSLLQTATNERFSPILIILFCAAVWIGIQFLGYIEFDAARRIVLGGAFRRFLSAHISVGDYEKRMMAASTPEEYWLILRDASRALGFAEVAMELNGMSYQDAGPDGSLSPEEFAQCAHITIPLPEGGSISFRYRMAAAMQRAIAMTTLVDTMRIKLEAAAAKSGALTGPHLQSQHLQGPGLMQADIAKSAEGVN